MSIESEITRITNAKAALKSSINSKGGNLNNELIDIYASQIDALPSHVELTQTAYDNLNTKDSNTYYLIVEES